MLAATHAQTFNAKLWLSAGISAALLLLLLTWLGLTPSHYAIGLKFLGLDAKPILGEARPIRSDEWIVLTPLFQIAVRGGFAVVDQVSPYHESLRSFLALPISDWSLLFKPQLWGFWLLPAPNAYALYFAILLVSFVLGYSIAMTLLGARPVIAILGALALYSSHFVQVWWTSNAPTFAFAPWPLVVFLLPIRPWIKGLMLSWTATFWIFGLVYPPFIISSAFAMAIAVLAFRRDALSLANILAAAAALIVTGILFYLYFSDIIGALASTIYPGQRSSNGGGVGAVKLLSFLFPFYSTFQLSSIAGENDCEIAVVSTLIPLLMLCFVKYNKIAKLFSANSSAFIVISVGLLAMLSWMILPIPASVGRVLLWSQVPPGRMVWGFGLLLTISLVVLASRAQFSTSLPRYIIFSIFLIGAWIASKTGVGTSFSTLNLSATDVLTRSWFDWVGVPLAAIVILIRRLKQGNKRPVPLTIAAVAGLITFGTFNPLQSALPIFDVPRSDFQDQLKRMAAENPNGWAVQPGWFGALINGAGIPSINHVLPVPQLEFFRRRFPDLTEPEFNEIFNRYAHIIPSEVASPSSPQADVVVIPIAPFMQ